MTGITEPPVDGGGGGGGNGGSGGTSVCSASGELPDLDSFGVQYDSDDGVQPAMVDITTDDTAGLMAVDSDVADAEIQVHFTDGTVGASGTAPNASFRQRGLTVRQANQKSYRIKLSSSAGLWHGQQVIHLNKHPWDLARVRQKLSFDLFRTVPHFATLQTRFVQLTVNGEDRGLYTAIENPDEHYLSVHGLPQGTVYSPVFFDFAPIADATWADPTALDAIIEAKTAPDDAKLRRMITAVNDPSMPINDVVRQYFNRQNYETWLAINVLVGNWDQGATNYLIYSPSGCEGWYFLPWDYDGSWDWYHQPSALTADGTLLTRWRAGLTVYWGSALHARFLRDPANVAEVEAVMQALSGGQITDAAVSALLDRYRDVVSAAVSNAPDVYYLPTPTMVSSPEAYAQWGVEYDRIRGVATQYQKEYQVARTRPAPIFIDAKDQGSTFEFDWGASYSFQGDALGYDLEVNRHRSFIVGPDMVVRMTGLTIPQGQSATSVVVGKPPSGHYYWRVIVRDQKRPDVDWQVPFDVYHDFTIP